jgi:REP element-mobilizing transposase RayT
MQYRRHRPHWFPENRAVFITWRVAGTVASEEVARALKTEQSGEGRRFVNLDALLDKAESGPRCLADPNVARVVCASLFRSDELGHYELDSYVIMSNHVHILCWPLIAVPKMMRSLKSFSARDANKIVHRTGESFWQDESFDHWCRSEIEHLKIRAYIENNPVKAGLVARAEDWTWSSASETGRPPRRRDDEESLLKRYRA